MSLTLDKALNMCNAIIYRSYKLLKLFRFCWLTLYTTVTMFKA